MGGFTTSLSQAPSAEPRILLPVIERETIQERYSNAEAPIFTPPSVSKEQTP
jgi:hypothetical protein